MRFRRKLIESLINKLDSEEAWKAFNSLFPTSIESLYFQEYTATHDRRLQLREDRYNQRRLKWLHSRTGACSDWSPPS